MNAKIISKPEIVRIIVQVNLPKKLDFEKLKSIDEFRKIIPKFESMSFEFENKTNLLVFKNNNIIASNDTLDKIIQTINCLKKYQMN